MDLVSTRRGLFVFFLLITLAILISVGAIGLMFLVGAAPPSMPSNATLYLHLRAPFDEIEPLDLLGAFSGRETATLRETIDAIHKAKRDPHVKALVILPSAEGALWGQLQEVHTALEDYRSSGKPLTAFLEAGGPEEYYLATAADRVVLMPAGQLDLTGLAMYELFFRGALDKIGVYPDLMHIGDYKTYSNTFAEKGYTPAHREMDQALNHDWYEQLVHAIATGRKKSDADIRTLLDNGPYLADEAKKAGLVDDLAYEDQIPQLMGQSASARVEDETYAKISVPNNQEYESNARITVLYAVGTIASGKSSFDAPGGQVVGSETFVSWIRKARVDTSTRAIVVRIDSPGGSAIASDVIWRELKLAAAAKPVIVSMGNVAASGGYYIAMPAQVVVAEPGTITGSIGVVTGKFAIGGTLDKLGIGEDSVQDGRFAELNSPFTPFSKDERAKVASQLQETYDLFLSRVAEGRHQTPAKIDTVAQGRVWTGHQAKDLGLVDEIGGLDTAITIARQKAKLDPKKNVDVVYYPAKRSVLDLLTDQGDTSLQAGMHVFARPTTMTRALNTMLSFSQLFRRGEPLAIMPGLLVR